MNNGPHAQYWRTWSRSCARSVPSTGSADSTTNPTVIACAVHSRASTGSGRAAAGRTRRRPSARRGRWNVSAPSDQAEQGVRQRPDEPEPGGHAQHGSAHGHRYPRPSWPTRRPGALDVPRVAKELGARFADAGSRALPGRGERARPAAGRARRATWTSAPARIRPRPRRSSAAGPTASTSWACSSAPSGALKDGAAAGDHDLPPGGLRRGAPQAGGDVRQGHRDRPVAPRLHDQRDGRAPARRRVRRSRSAGCRRSARESLDTPLDPEVAFSDDPLRMVRAARFVAQLDVTPAPRVVDGDRARCASGSRSCRAERIARRARQAAGGAAAPARARAAGGHRARRRVPAGAAGAAASSRTPCTSTRTCCATPTRWSSGASRTWSCAWPRCCTTSASRGPAQITPEGVSFHHHEVVGARMARERLAALRYPNARDRRRVHADRAPPAVPRLRRGVDRQRGAPVRARRRAAARRAQPAHARRRAPPATSSGPSGSRALQDELEERIAALAEEENLDAMRPPLDGRQVMERLGLARARRRGGARVPDGDPHGARPDRRRTRRSRCWTRGRRTRDRLLRRPRLLGAQRPGVGFLGWRSTSTRRSTLARAERRRGRRSGVAAARSTTCPRPRRARSPRSSGRTSSRGSTPCSARCSRSSWSSAARIQDALFGVGPDRERADRHRAGAARQTDARPAHGPDRAEGARRARRRGLGGPGRRGRAGRRARRAGRRADRGRRRGRSRADGLEVDESLLTGESDPVAQAAGRRGALRLVRGGGVGSVPRHGGRGATPTRRGSPRTPGASRSRARSSATASTGSCSTSRGRSCRPRSCCS